jgi:hypothetical protein
MPVKNVTVPEVIRKKEAVTESRNQTFPGFKASGFKTEKNNSSVIKELLS